MATKKKTTPKRKFKGVRKPKSTQFTQKQIKEFKKNYNGSYNSLYLRKHPAGAPKIFETPEAMQQAMCEYFEFVDSTPFVNPSWKNDSKGGLVMVETPVRRPYSIGGMMLYFGTSDKYLNVFCIQRQMEIDDPKTPKHIVEMAKEFLNIIDWGRTCVREQKFDGAAVGHFNANLISIDLGMVKKMDITSDGEAIKQPEFKVYNNAPPLADSEDKVDKKKK